MYRKLALIVALLAPGYALAQSYGSPHYNNMTVDGTITGGTISGANASDANVTATGSTTARTQASRAAEVINVKNYGAVGNCSTDDSAAFNAAFAYIRSHPTNVAGNTVYLRLDVPTACYVIASTINATSLRNFNTTWDFHGSTLWGKTNGTPIIDAMGSRFITVRDLTIYGDPTLTPNIGFQHGITQNSPFSAADDNSFEHMATFGAFSLAAWYNRNAEQSIWLNPQIRNTYVGTNSYGMIFDGMNHFNVTSAFVTTTYPQDTSTTFLADTIIGADVRHTGGGHALFLGDTNSHRWISGYLNTAGGAGYDVSTQAITAGGSGYTTATVTYPAGCTVTPTGVAVVSAGAVTRINLTDPGNGCPSSIAAPAITGGGTGATASVPVMVQDGAASVVLYAGTTGLSDMSFDVHTEAGNSRNVFEVQSSLVTTPVLNGFTYRDQNPFNAGSIFTALSPITGVTIQGLDIPFLGVPHWSSMTMFGTPAMWTVIGKAYMSSPGMWNGPALAQMVITAPLGDQVLFGAGSYVLNSASGFGTMMKGNITQLGTSATTGQALALFNAGNNQNSFSNGLVQPKRSDGQGGLRIGHGQVSNWVATIAEDGNSGVELRTGGTTGGGTQALDADSSQNVTIGLPSLATSATTGFPYLPSVAGTPTGAPTAKTGYSPVVIDTTNNKICFYNGAWKCAAGS